MASKAVAAGAGPRAHALSSETLETCRLLVDFLHAAYAARRESDLEGPGDISSGPYDQPADDARLSDSRSARKRAISEAERGGSRLMSSHAVRAAVHVHEHGQRTIGQLATGLGISYGWASRVVDELEAAHYVIRERDLYDHRIVRISLDPAAIEAVERAYRWRERDVREALEPLSDDERDAVRVFLREVTDRLRKSREEHPKSAGLA
jgi:DNA-binding MarR family transcriptional regulator